MFSNNHIHKRQICALLALSLVYFTPITSFTVSIHHRSLLKQKGKQNGATLALQAIALDNGNTALSLGPSASLCGFDIHKFGSEYSLWADDYNGTSSSISCHTSPNGLSFIPNPSSLQGASLAPNVDDWWYFDTHSVSVGSVLPASTGDGKECLLMYYTGSDGSGRRRIGTAVTQNGVDWGRIEGPEPNGNLFPGEENSDPTVVRSGERSYMFFNRDGKICLATQEPGKFEFTIVNSDVLGLDDVGRITVKSPGDVGGDGLWSMYFSKGGEIFEAKGETQSVTGEWSVPPEPLKLPTDGKFSCPRIVETEEGDRLYYISEKEGGEKTIEVAKKIGEEWAELKLPTI
ncbi:hypothetical protein TrVE_jg9968 [Triparma verrucosa]|uniref:Uncharacterized protein n=1 Tax=Triparma verrucosa TaxID=1606542 RepID=A0A9W7DLN4_9STRA|nr:hypothetical protein TrVE_jg9968 [Triparma verrucosa]